MARGLTKKQRGYVNDKADGKPGVIAALNNYDTDDYGTANSISVENLQKPAIQEELRKLGFDSNNAKRVISNILNDDSLEPKDRIKAAENIFKVHGDYAPEKSVNVVAQVVVTDRIKQLADRLRATSNGKVFISERQSIRKGIDTKEQGAI